MKPDIDFILLIRHFLSQNTAIDHGKVSGIKLNLKVLGIGDGLIVC